MLPASWSVLAILTAILGVSVPFLVWGWLHGQFENVDEQKMVPFDADDMRYERIWENEAARSERVRAYGPLIKPQPGEWGGAS